MSGLILGKIDRPWPSLLAAVAGLFDPRVNSEDACKRFYGTLRQRGWKKPEAPLVRLNGIHSLCIAPSGSGKGTSGVIPFLMASPESHVVLDFGGTLARETLHYREKYFGHNCVLLDPYDETASKLGRKSDSLNVLDFTDRNAPHALDDVRDLANALVPRTGKEHGDATHFLDAAEIMIAGMIAVTVRHGQKHTRSLQTVRDLLANPQAVEAAIKVMQESPEAWGGMLARMGHSLTHFKDRELASTMTTATRMLRFLDSPAIAANTSSTSFDPFGLARGKTDVRKTDVFLVIPAQHATVLSPLLRTWVGFFLKIAMHGGVQENNLIHFDLDEAASLAAMEQIIDILAIGRKFGARLHLYYQSMGQLKKAWGSDGQDQTILSNTSQTFFAINDLETAKYVSDRIGEGTIVVHSGGSSTSRSRQISMGQSYGTSSTYSDSSSRNWQQIARKLAKPEELMTWPERTAITFVPGLPPLLTTLLRHYEEPRRLRPKGWWRRSCAAAAVLASAVYLLLCAVLAAAAAWALWAESGVSRLP